MRPFTQFIVGIWSIAAVYLAVGSASAGAQSPAAEADRADVDPTAPDRFRPGFDARKDKLPEPTRGGSVVVHVDSMPRHLNYFIENSGTTRRITDEVHETLMARDPWTLEMRLVLAESLETADTLVRRDGARLFGRVSEIGDAYEFTPLARGDSTAAATQRVPKADVERVERETVFTFKLRPNVKWHDGRPLRVEDFLLTWRLSKNPLVECGEKRFEYDHIVGAEKLDERTLRFFYDRQYFGAHEAFGALIPLPAHRYDLLDPLNPEHDPEADERRQAEYVNTHPCNRAWIGLGPYRITRFTSEFIEAQRFDDYFDPAHSGWLDTIRWRFFASATAAYGALLDGELDFVTRLPADEYFASANEPRFTATFYRGYYYTPQMMFVGWNLLRPQFADVRVRRALAMAFDWDEFARSYYRGLAQRVTAEWFDGGRDYDHEVEPLPFDLDAAAKLLSDAGWYDRDGDGSIDKDGRAFEIRLLVQAGNPTGDAFGQKYQENLRKLGVRLALEPMEWAALSQKVLARDFDAEFKAWVMPVESSPEQRWHSRSVGPDTANDTSFSDPEIDRWIDAFTSELDPDRRGAIARKIHRTLYDAQAYNYGVKVPNKFAVHKRIRNVRVGPVDPGYSIREWYIAP